MDTLSDTQKRYRDYLNTDYWKAVSDAVKARANYRCSVCNRPDNLAAHHRSYKHRGNELEHLEDLICLCTPCHTLFHVRQQQEKEKPKYDNVPGNGYSTIGTRNRSGFVQVNHRNCHKIMCYKEAWHWMQRNGIKPSKKGWRKRAIGRWIPSEYMFQY